MTQEGFKRKLTAILSADVEGYSRLMGQDEDATVRTLTTYRKAIADLITEHSGRVVDTPGDNILAEFTSVVNAMRCAWDIQHEININPNAAGSYGNIGWVFLWSGKVDEAIRNLEKSLRLDSSTVSNTLWHLGMAYYLKGRYQDAQAALQRGVIKKPNFVGYHIGLAATFAQLGRQSDAKRSAEKVLQLNPFFEVRNYGTAFQNQADRDKIIEGLRKAGLN